MHEGNASESRSGISTFVVELIVAALLLLVGIVVIIESRRLGSGWTSDGPGSGYFPFWIGTVLTLSGLGIVFEAVKKRDTEIFVDGEQLKRVLLVLVPLSLYVVGVQFLGLYLASAIFIILFMVFLGKYSWLKAVLVGVCTNALFFFMFEVWFKVPLFKGSLDPLRFLGY